MMVRLSTHISITRPQGLNNDNNSAHGNNIVSNNNDGNDNNNDNSNNDNDDNDYDVTPLRALFSEWT